LCDIRAGFASECAYYDLLEPSELYAPLFRAVQEKSFIGMFNHLAIPPPSFFLSEYEFLKIYPSFGFWY
jgi:hypothetical protein